MQPPTVNQVLASALRHHARGDHAVAARDFQAVLLQRADQPVANLHLGQYAKARGDFSAARTFFTTAVAGVTRDGRPTQAVPAFAELASLEHDASDAAAALKAARAGQDFCGEQPWLLWEECEALRLANRPAERLLRLNRLALLQPNDRVILTELGLALLCTASAVQAVFPLRRAIELGLKDTEITLALVVQEMARGELSPAQSRLETLSKACPEHLGVLGLRWLAHQRQSEWSAASAIEAELLGRLEKGERHPAITPFMLLLSSASPRLLFEYSQSRAHELAQPASAAAAMALTWPVFDAARRLRVAYLSADLHEHATAILMAGLFELHDRDRFELFAYSYGPRVDDAYRSRLRAAVPNWRDVNDDSDAAAAARIQADGIDVLVELKGHTLGVRLGITALRPAPVIIHYLGYPGTMASSGIDYLVADATTVPFAHEAYYTETILRMPRCYQVNDHRRSRPAASTRDVLGLPQCALVLCNFNQSSKWTAAFFFCWLRALKRAPHACLWLLDPGVAIRERLEAHAHSLGVAEKIIWAPKLPPNAHLARLAAADLALDQLPYASHTTGADALWMGVPLLTCIGDAFHGRVGASLLNAVDLPSFVTEGIEAYEQRLNALLDDRSEIDAAKRHLNKNRLQLPLFDTVQFTRNWEALLMATRQRVTPCAATPNMQTP